jgi:2,3-dimethylmalate lyase
MRRVCREVAGPQLANVSQARGKAVATLAELEAAGAAAVTFPSFALYAAAAAVDRAMAALRRDGTIDAFTGELMTLARYNKLVGLDEHLQREQRYDEAAARLAAGLSAL